MGLLDEAIREHLELKRRRGADASEVSRQEQEALGPARRGPEPLEVPPDDDAGAPEHHGVESDVQDGGSHHDPEPHEPEPYAEAEAPEPEYHEPDATHAEPAYAPSAEAEPPPHEAHDPHPAAEPPVGEQTMAFDVASEIAQEDEQPAHEQPAHEPEPEAPAGGEHEEGSAQEPAEGDVSRSIPRRGRG